MVAEYELCMGGKESKEAVSGSRSHSPDCNSIEIVSKANGKTHNVSTESTVTSSSNSWHSFLRKSLRGSSGRFRSKRSKLKREPSEKSNEPSVMEIASTKSVTKKKKNSEGVEKKSACISTCRETGLRLWRPLFKQTYIDIPVTKSVGQQKDLDCNSFLSTTTTIGERRVVSSMRELNGHARKSILPTSKVFDLVGSESPIIITKCTDVNRTPQRKQLFTGSTPPCRPKLVLGTQAKINQGSTYHTINAKNDQRIIIHHEQNKSNFRSNNALPPPPVRYEKSNRVPLLAVHSSFRKFPTRAVNPLTHLQATPGTALFADKQQWSPITPTDSDKMDKSDNEQTSYLLLSKSTMGAVVDDDDDDEKLSSIDFVNSGQTYISQSSLTSPKLPTKLKTITMTSEPPPPTTTVDNVRYNHLANEQKYLFAELQETKSILLNLRNLLTQNLTNPECGTTKPQCKDELSCSTIDNSAAKDLTGHVEQSTVGGDNFGAQEKFRSDSSSNLDDLIKSFDGLQYGDGVVHDEINNNNDDDAQTINEPIMSL